MIAHKTKQADLTRHQLEITNACQRARELENSGEYERAAEALGDLWTGTGARADLSGLPDALRAEVLVRIGSLTGWLGSSRQIEGFQEKAKDLISEGVRIFEELGHRARVAEAQSDLGICYWREGANLEARQYLEDALDKLPPGNPGLRGMILLRLFNTAISARKYRQARRLLDQAEEVILKQDDDLLKGKFYFHRALVAKILYEHEPDPDRAAEAVEDYRKASRFYRRVGHRRYESFVENNLGFLFLSMGRFKEAHDHLNNAIGLFSGSHDAGPLAAGFDTKARVFLAENKLIEAEVFAQKSVALLEEGDECGALAESLTTLGTIYARQKSYADAKEAFETAIEKAVYVGDTESAALTRLAQIEEMHEVLSDEEKSSLFTEAKRVFLAAGSPENPQALQRLREAAKLCPADEESGDWNDFNLTEEVRRFEARYIKKALIETGGSVTKAARLLGITHQHLSLLLKKRHRDLAYAKKPRRRRSDRKKKRK